MKRWKYLRFVFLAAVAGYYFCIPEELFRDSYSTVLKGSNGELLTATTAPDGQWRFRNSGKLPEKYVNAVVAFEDKRFFSHPGVDPIAFSRAVKQNVSAGQVVSGGSTITMQVIRLSRKGRSRSIVEKAIEMIMATRLTLRYTKDEILNLYAANAPFGGNVVGLDAACWRYFGREPGTLSWSEACLLAVLPNSPSMLHPGKNRERLKDKRNALLDKLRSVGLIDSLTCELGKEEDIPERPKELPRYARHLLLRAARDGRKGETISTTVDYGLQQQVERIVGQHHLRLESNQIHNAAVLVLEVETGNVLSYVGNVASGENNGSDVDVINSRRSTGSILKPFLYAAMLDEGKILSRTLVPDIPTILSGFAPHNFSHDYDGAVPANEALTRSLNVPAVHLLMDYRYEKFHSLLKRLGLTTLDNDPDWYGLSLILGGAEGTLWDIAGTYASMARTLNHYFDHPGANRYRVSDYFSPGYISQAREGGDLSESSIVSSASIYQVFDILTEVHRPGEESGWRYFESSKKIAWKTGTSFGFRDGWAIGTTPEFVVGVWVGNADGEGRPGLTGTDAASPIMFDVFSILPGTKWFSMPRPEMVQVPVCRLSGMRIGQNCAVKDTVWISKPGLNSESCHYHRIVHLSPDEKYQVHSSCESLANSRSRSWFVLPPVQEYYYRPKNLSYKNLPPYRGDCAAVSDVAAMELVYPRSNASVFIPRDLGGTKGNVVVEAVHRDPKATIYWHLDGDFLGVTKASHRMAINTTVGKHKLVLVDAAGTLLERELDVVSSM